VFPGEEDFGIIPVEAQACGAPVIAPALGGVLDTVVDGATGTLYNAAGDQAGALADAMSSFEDGRFDRNAIRAHAEHFAPARFRECFERAVEGILRGEQPTDLHPVLNGPRNSSAASSPSGLGDTSV
jgi:glycosyltransferase involved in cell wall biosynthesis